MKEKILKITKILPLIIMVALAIVYLCNMDKLTVDEIIDFTPDSTVLFILVMLSFFALKSISVLMPNPVLMAVLGKVLSVPLALTVSVVGYAICVSIPYFIGRFSGAEKADELRQKYKGLRWLDTVQKKNVFFINLLTRQLIFLPCDVISLYMGSMKMKYLPYLFGSVIGYFPNIFIYVVFGNELKQPGSPLLIGSIIFSVVLSAAAITYYVVSVRKESKREKEEEK